MTRHDIDVELPSQERGGGEDGSGAADGASTSRPDPGPDAQAPDSTHRRIPAEPGVWVFLFGDLGIFVVFFIAFLVARAEDRELFESSREAIGIAIGFTNTLVLLTSSLLVVLGLGAIRAGMHTIAARMFAAAIGCGLLFAIFKAIEYTHMVNSGHGPVVNSYYNYFFILTGIHLFHVVIGMGLLGYLVALSRRGGELTRTRVVIFEAVGCYWHLVDLLWMMLFPLLYLVG